MKKYLKLGLKVFISLTLILWLLKSQDVESIKKGLASFSFGFLIAALGFQLLGTYFSALRWQAILKTSEVSIPLRYLYVLYLKGYFYNNFLPTQMGGDLYKSVSLGRKIDNQSVSLFSVFMDRFGGLVVLLIMGMLGILSLYGTNGLVFAVVALIAGALIYQPALHLADKFLGSKIKLISNFKKANELFMKDKESALRVLAYSVLVQVCSFGALYIVFEGLGVSLPLWSVFAFMPIASLSLLIPSFNGFGTQETVYAFLFSEAGVTSYLSIAASIIVHLMRIVLSLVGGVLILFNIE